MVCVYAPFNFRQKLCVTYMIRKCHFIWLDNCNTITAFAEYEYYSHYGPDTYYGQYYAMLPYYKGYYEEMGIPQVQEHSYGRG